MWLDGLDELTHRDLTERERLAFIQGCVALIQYLQDLDRTNNDSDARINVAFSPEEPDTRWVLVCVIGVEALGEGPRAFNNAWADYIRFLICLYSKDAELLNRLMPHRDFRLRELTFNQDEEEREKLAMRVGISKEYLEADPPYFDATEKGLFIEKFRRLAGLGAGLGRVPGQA